MNAVKFPSNLIEPIRRALHLEAEKLNHTKSDLEKEDPFNDPNRLTDNAASDTDAAEQFGHTNVEGNKREVDRRLIQIKKALARIRIGKYGICEKCGQMIDTDRLMIFPEATVCIKCEKERQK